MRLTEEIINQIKDSKESIFTGEQVITIINNITKSNSKRIVDEEDGVAVDLSSGSIEIDGKKKIAAKKIIQIAHHLLSNKTRTFTREELLADIWEDDVVVGIRTIDVHIRKLRILLDEKYVTTVKGVGYRWK
jgi:two-component system alkaline phosphatase synthesis response regulator PhoP